MEILSCFAHTTAAWSVLSRMPPSRYCANHFTLPLLGKPQQTSGYCRGRLCLIQATTELVDDSCQFILVGAVGHSSGIVHDQDMLAIKADFGGLIDSDHDQSRVRLSPYSMQTKVSWLLCTGDSAVTWHARMVLFYCMQLIQHYFFSQSTMWKIKKVWTDEF